MPCYLLEDIQESLLVWLLPPLPGYELQELIERDGEGSIVTAHLGHQVLSLG